MPGEDLDRLIRLNVSSDDMEARVQLDPELDVADITQETLETVLTAASIQLNGDRKEAIRNALAALQEGGEREFLVAKGTPAKDGVDGCFEPDESIKDAVEEMLKKKRQRDADLDESESAQEKQSPDEQAEDGAVDFYNQSHYSVVQANQSLGRIEPPVPGRDGEDVYGKTIVAKQAKPAALKTDDTVSLRSNGDVLAIEEGLLDVTPNALRIVQAMHIRGYVDFSTGNVEFPRDAIVDQGVRDCFKILLGGSLTVNGLIEAADIVVAGDAVLHRGMAGREKGTLTVGRDLEATYLDSVKCIVGRDLCMSKELTNSKVTVGHECRSPRCRVVGGTLVVAGECELAQAGTEGGAVTEIALGHVGEVEHLIAEASSLIPDVQKRAVRTRTRYKKLRENPGQLTATEAEEMTELQFNLNQFESKLSSLLDTVENLCGLVKDRRTISLIIHKKIHTGVTVWLGGQAAEITQDLKGPIKLDLDDQGIPQATDLTSQSVIPLSSVARVYSDDRWIDVVAVEKAVWDARAA